MLELINYGSDDSINHEINSVLGNLELTLGLAKNIDDERKRKLAIESIKSAKLKLKRIKQILRGENETENI